MKTTNYRISKDNNGYFAEKEYKSVFFKTKWKPYITYFGSDVCYYYNTKEQAVEALNKKIKEEVFSNSYLSDNTWE